MVHVLNYYGGGNTARGFKDFYDSIFQGLDTIYSLDGGSNIFKVGILKNLANYYAQNSNIEIVNSAVDNEEIEGVIVRDKKIAIVNGNPVHGRMISAQDVAIIEINLDEALDEELVGKRESEISELRSEYNNCLNKSHEEFLKGLQIHDQWEKVYIANMNFDKANDLTDRIITTLVSEEESNVGNGLTYHRYLGAATPLGSRDFVPNITDGVKRYFVKGRPGTGKSTMLKKIVNAAVNKGYDVEVYHCGFDPNSLDMVISRELNFAIFDSTAPHEYFPDREDDEIIDNYKELIVPGTDEKYENHIREIANKYKSQIKAGTAWLAESKVIKDKIDNIYYQSFDTIEGNKIVSKYLCIDIDE